MNDYKSRMCPVSQKKVRPVIYNGMVPPCSCVFFPSVLPFPLEKAPSVEAAPFTGLPAVCPRGCCLPRAAARRSSLAKPQPWLQQSAIIYLIKPSLKTSKVIILHSDMDLRNKGVCEFFSPDTCSLVHTVGLCSCEHALIEERIIE